MNKIIQDMIPTKKKPPLYEAIPVERANNADRPEKNIPRKQLIRKTPSGIVGTRTVKPWLFMIIAAICLLAIVYAFSIMYARATVYLTPTSIAVPFDSAYTAYENATAASGTLAYKIIQTSDQLHQSVPASIGPVATTYARGTVILYNDYTASSQKIIAGTRLQSGNGLIYTTNISVIIPGINKGVAGSIAVNVTAAEAGPSYNILPSDLTTNPSYGDFNIVAYKGTARYTGFYARLNPDGSGITGGSSGHQIITSSSTVSAAAQAMDQSLQQTLLAKAQTLVPDGYVMFSDDSSTNYSAPVASTTSSTTADVIVQATFSGIMFQKNNLAQIISPSQYTNSFDPQDLQSAQFTITNPQTFSATNGQPLNFKLKGTMNLVGIIATSTIASQLAGISLSQSASIFKGYSTIANAHVTILPFWKHSFPSSSARINVVIQK